MKRLDQVGNGDSIRDGGLPDRLETSDLVRARMSRQARRDTEPEVLLRRALYAAGLRYRIGVPVPGRPRRSMDIAFVGARVGVFVDGCFWHACPVHASWPANNASWWRKKLEANAARDRDTDSVMRAAGWEVVRVWEHEDPVDSAPVIRDLVERRRVQQK